MDFAGKVGIGDNLYIELVGTDADNTSIDSAMVTITSSITDPNGISVQLLESAADSGIYRGVVIVGETSDSSTGTIGVCSSAVETITVISDIEPGMQDSINTIDKYPAKSFSVVFRLNVNRRDKKILENFWPGTYCSSGCSINYLFDASFPVSGYI